MDLARRSRDDRGMAPPSGFGRDRPGLPSIGTLRVEMSGWVSRSFPGTGPGQRWSPILRRSDLERSAQGMGVSQSIVLQSVTKEYRRDEFRIPVLVDLDLSVDEGEYLALMGPSGSG